MATAAAASAMASQFANMTMVSSSSSSSSTSGSALSSSFTGLALRRRQVVVPALRPRNVVVQAKGGFIPAEHRWMYEGIEKMGPVSITTNRNVVSRG